MQSIKKAIAIFVGLSIVLLIAVNLLYLILPTNGPGETAEQVSSVAGKTFSWTYGWLKPVANDPVMELLHTLSPLQRLIGIIILSVAAYGFIRILASRDGSMAKSVAYVLSAIAVVYLLIGFLPSFDGDDVSSARSKSSYGNESKEMNRVTAKIKLKLPAHGTVTLDKKDHCYVDNRFDEVLKKTRRYESKTGKQVIFSSNLDHSFELAVAFYNTNLSCRAGAKRLEKKGLL